MPLNSEIVGKSTEPVTHPVDARWIMSFAAGLGDFNPRYLDTAAQPIVAHPLFPACLEWPAVLASRSLPGYDTLTADEAARGVHATHHLEILRPIVEGDSLSTRATLTGVQAIKPGAALLCRLDTVDAREELVARTHQLAILRGVEVVGEAKTIEDAPAPPVLETPWAETQRVPIPVSAGAAHTYTECARIWNPVHTDRAVALAAGLPDIILHGSATLALAVTRLVDDFLGGDPVRVRRLGGRFTAIVRTPSTIELEVYGHEHGALFFRLHSGEPRPAFSGGFLCYE